MCGTLQCWGNTQRIFPECCVPAGILHAISRNKKTNVLNNNKPFFDQPVKNKQEEYDKLIEMSRSCDYITWNLLDFSHQQNYYKLISINLSR